MKRVRKTIHAIVIETLAFFALLAVVGSSFLVTGSDEPSQNSEESSSEVARGATYLKDRLADVAGSWREMSSSAEDRSEQTSNEVAGTTNGSDGLFLSPDQESAEDESDAFSRDPENVRSTLESAGQRLLARFSFE